MAHSYAGARMRAEAGIRPQAKAGLLWTDAWFLCGIAIAALVTTDPLEWGLASGVLKHLALAVALPAATLALLLRRALLPSQLRGNARPLAEPLAVAWPLALFALMALCGGAYARAVLGYSNTFLNYGLYALMTFVAAAMVAQTPAPLAFARAYLAIICAAALAMSALLVFYAGVRQVYHEQIFLVIPMAALCFAGRSPAALRWGGALFFLLMAWFSHKYTSYLVAALTAVYLAAFVWLPRLRGHAGARTAAAYWGAFGFAAAGVVAATYALRGGDDAPTGNLEFRLHTYQASWQRFLESPLWGNGFTREAAEKFTLYDVGVARNMLPTHSDLLDLLANGGAVAFILCGAGIAAIFALAWRRLLRPALLERPEARYAHTLALIVLAAILTCFFNPILLQPPMAILAWSSLGMLLGLALRAPPGPDG